MFSPYIFTLSGDNLKNKCVVYPDYYFWIISMLMILLLTLRHDYVGTDTQNYRWTYEIFKNIDFYNALKLNPDIGFTFIFYKLANLNVSFRIILLTQAILYIGAVTLIIKKFSNIPALSYWIFITFGFFIFATTFRQAVALSFVILAFDQIYKGKMIKFMVLVFIASTFHLSALIFLPMYWINKFDINKFTLIIIVIIAITIILCRDVIGLYLLKFSVNEYLQTDTSGYFQILLVGLLLMLAIIYNVNFFKNNTYNKILFFMLVVKLVLTPISKINPALFRLTSYFWLFVIIYIPNLIVCINEKYVRFLLIYGSIALGILIFYFKLESYGIRMHPYVFFWDLYPIYIF